MTSFRRRYSGLLPLGGSRAASLGAASARGGVSSTAAGTREGGVYCSHLCAQGCHSIPVPGPALPLLRSDWRPLLYEDDASRADLTTHARRRLPDRDGGGR